VILGEGLEGPWGRSMGGGEGGLGRWGHSRPDGTTDPREPGEGWQERPTTLTRTHDFQGQCGRRTCINHFGKLVLYSHPCTIP
jgi:hypothetical protein